MKKILVCLLLFFTLGGTNASFNSGYTSITSDTTFLKNSGTDELRVSEDYVINPFSNSDIKRNTTICTWNNCPCWVSGCSFTTGYTVDWKLFNSSHSKYKPANSIRRNWYNYSDGIDSSIRYLQNTYTTEDWVLKPRQSVKVRRYYITWYNHDTSTPTCWEVNYYNDEALTQGFTYNGGWLNSPKYFTMTCLDAQTWCYCDPSDSNCQIQSWKVISTPQLLWHNINPTVSFTNTVRLTDVSCQPGGTFQKVLFDLKTPKFDIALAWEDFGINLEALRVYELSGGKKLDGIEVPGQLQFTRSWSINQLVGDTQIDLVIEDSFLSGSVHGVSGLKDFEFKILRNTDTSFRSIPQEELTSCWRSEVISSQYNPSGNLETTDSRTLNFNCNDLRTAWAYDFVFTSHDWAWNETIATTKVNLYPSALSLSQSALRVSSNTDKYANNLDTYEYEIELKDQYRNPLFGLIIDEPVQSVQNYAGGKELLLPDTTTPLLYDYNSTQTDEEGIYRFSMKSLLPWTYTNRFTLSYNSWDENYNQNGPYQSIFITNNNENAYQKPFSAALVFLWPWDSPELGTEHNYRIDISNDGGVSWYTNSNININSTTLNFSSPHRFDSLSWVDNTFSEPDLTCWYTWTFNATNSIWVLQTPVIEINNMLVRYRLGWKNVRYTLDSYGMSWCAVSTVWLKTTWTAQWDGKWEISWWNANISDISTSLLRSQIRQEAYEMIRWMNSWDTINWVRYIEWDVQISWNLSYETLVVKNGNIIISDNLNTSWKILGLISLKDSWYDIQDDYDNSGNIYVTNNVENISANIYADGTFRSANSSWIEYSDSQLDKKLILTWTLFTRNTIWGGILAGSDYILPGWSTTNNRILASTYDLNYIRRAQTCWEVDDYSFLIQYDPRIQSTPPKWFNIK